MHLDVGGSAGVGCNEVIGDAVRKEVLSAGHSYTRATLLLLQCAWQTKNERTKKSASATKESERTAHVLLRAWVVADTADSPGVDDGNVE